MSRPRRFRCRDATLAHLLFFGAAASAFAAAPDVMIAKAEFGLFEDDGSEQIGFRATGEVPLNIGQACGWLIERKLAATLDYDIAMPAENPQAATRPPARQPAGSGKKAGRRM
jgi:hypothetical protein